MSSFAVGAFRSRSRGDRDEEVLEDPERLLESEGGKGGIGNDFS